MMEVQETLLIVTTLLSSCNSLEWFVAPPEDDAGTSILDISDILDEKLSDTLSLPSQKKDVVSDVEEGRGGREPKQFRLPNFSALTTTTNLLAPSSTFCE